MEYVNVRLAIYMMSSSVLYILYYAFQSIVKKNIDENVCIRFW